MEVLREGSLPHPPSAREPPNPPSELELGKKSGDSLFTLLTRVPQLLGGLGRHIPPPGVSPLIQATVLREKRTGSFVCYKKGSPGHREGGETWGPRDGSICSVLARRGPGFGTRRWPALEPPRASSLFPPALQWGRERREGCPQFCFPPNNPRSLRLSRPAPPQSVCEP